MNILNKSFMTNFIALVIIILGFIFSNYTLQQIGFFALSGAITNYLAIIMIFDKIPFIYGSGVIQNKFEGFKKAIKEIMIEYFFNKENLQNFIEEKKKTINLKLITDKIIDYDKLFDNFVELIMESNFGTIIENFLGGKDVLEDFREEFKVKIKSFFENTITDENNKETILNSISSQSSSEFILKNIDDVIESSLNQLTPKLVKEMVQKIIKEHLGWLVVWGGIFGGLIGFVLSFV